MEQHSVFLTSALYLSSERRQSGLEVRFLVFLEDEDVTQGSLVNGSVPVGSFLARPLPNHLPYYVDPSRL